MRAGTPSSRVCRTSLAASRRSLDTEFAGELLWLLPQQFQTGHDLRLIEPVFTEGEELEEFKELADNMEMVASAISEDASIEAVIGNIFADD